MRYRVVDVFTDRPLAGNALCVVIDPCPEERMQPIAREMNLSETTFVTSQGDGSYSMRIFTPGGELPFAGHPTLGTAWLMGPGQWMQTTTGGRIPVTVDDRGAEMTQPNPDIHEVADDGLHEAVGVDRVVGAWRAEAAGNAHVVAAVEQSLDDLKVHPALVQDVLDRHATTTLAVVRTLDSATLRVRVFFRAVGVAEDPGTGSAAGPVAVIARRLWGLDTDLLIRQGDEIGRPCRIRVHADADDLRVGGDVVLSAEGRLAV